MACDPPGQMKTRVVPAKAGTHCGLGPNWIPAFAGMTKSGVIFRRAAAGIYCYWPDPLLEGVAAFAARARTWDQL